MQQLFRIDLSQIKSSEATDQRPITLHYGNTLLSNQLPSKFNTLNHKIVSDLTASSSLFVDKQQIEKTELLKVQKQINMTHIDLKEQKAIKKQPTGKQITKILSVLEIKQSYKTLGKSTMCKSIGEGQKKSDTLEDRMKTNVKEQKLKQIQLGNKFTPRKYHKKISISKYFDPHYV